MNQQETKRTVDSGEDLSREIVVRRAQAGDLAAYGELVRRYGSVVYAVALTRLGNPTEAEEITQEVFVHSMNRLGQLRDPRCIAAWLRRIAVRLAVGRRGRCRPVTDAANLLGEVPGREAGPLEQLICTEEGNRLRATLQELNPTDRAMLEAFYLEFPLVA